MTSTCRPCLAASCLTTSKICACGPAVTPTFNGLSCARAACATNVAPRASAASDLKNLVFMMRELRVGKSSAMRHAAYQPVSQALHDLHLHDQHHHRGHHDLRLEALVSVADAQVAQAAAADVRRPGRISE